MSGNKCFWCNIITLGIIGAITAVLFIVSLGEDYQLVLAREHLRFRGGFPSQANWIDSPYGQLKSYLFNVTNAESFLNGTDAKLNLQEIGPIVYRIKGRNEVLDQTESTITYQKIRYHEVEFDADASCAPDILNKTIIVPNFVLLGTAAKLHDWVSLVRHAFNAITINESVFLNQTVNYFLWDFTTPALNVLSNYIPNMVANCGMLYNALRKKDEIYNVKIGIKNGIDQFFRVNSLNNKTYFSEQSSKLKFLQNNKSNIFCPINVVDSFDNSLFQPFVLKDSEISIVAAESCRTLQMKYKKTVNHLGLKAYQFILSNTTPAVNCLDNALGIKLPQGLFDVSKCLFNDVPSAFSLPHFFGTSYNWSQHIEGLSPNEEYHETSITIQPKTGIPIEEKYRFQSNIPMPDMKGYNKDLQRFSHMIIPTFWYEYDLDDLPPIVLFLLKFTVFVTPLVQHIVMIILIVLALCCSLGIYTLIKKHN